MRAILWALLWCVVGVPIWFGLLLVGALWVVSKGRS